MSSADFDTTGARKTEARRRLRAALGAMSAEARAAASTRIREHLAAGTRLRDASTVLAFAALPDEPDLLPLAFGAAANGPGKRSPGPTWVFPRVVDRETLELREVTCESGLVPGRHGIREPDPARCPLIAPERIDLALVPGLGFRPADGLRLGRGGGYYDRLLAGTFAGTAIGVGFDCQFVDDLPAEPHDCHMDLLVGPRGWITTLPPAGPR